VADTGNMTLWVEGLESGLFRQGFSRLTTYGPNGEFDCCLGVACKIAIRHDVVLPVKYHPDIFRGAESNRGYVSYGCETAALPVPVRKWLGLDRADPPVAGMMTASDANDVERIGFKGIAALLRRTYNLGA
jgi:hypothetical protein